MNRAPTDADPVGARFVAHAHPSAGARSEGQHQPDRTAAAGTTVGISRYGQLGPLLLAAFLVILALPPRLLDTDRFVTTDELFWIGRSAAFGRAIETRQLGQ